MNEYVIYAGWALYAVSFFLPVDRLFESPLMGWQAFLFSFAFLVEFYKDAGSAWFALSAFANVGILMSPVFLWKARKGRWRWGWKVMAACSAIACSYFFSFGSTGGAPFIGYYVWAASFPLVAAGLYLRGRGREGVGA